MPRNSTATDKNRHQEKHNKQNNNKHHHSDSSAASLFTSPPFPSLFSTITNFTVNMLCSILRDERDRTRMVVVMFLVLNIIHRKIGVSRPHIRRRLFMEVLIGRNRIFH